tara:strand:+ start:7526 stop:7765 length:240 start_codon:yes stop_codon:yes gene_type:complete
MNLEPAKPEKESLRSWMVKLEAYREWYRSLPYLDKIMFKIKGLPEECRIDANIAVQELKALVGEEKANQLMKENKYKAD